MPKQKPGRSRQDYQTPRQFIDAVEDRFGSLDLDLAAHQGNHITPRYYGPGGLVPDSLAVEWPLTGNLWLNPEFGYITPWAKKCYESKQRPNNQAYIFFLVPASVGSDWYAEWVHDKAYVLALNGRIPFDPARPTWGYPKDCILAVFGPRYLPGFTIWNWRKR
jgi:phage N-6-adenine-methyltransferase